MPETYKVSSKLNNLIVMLQDYQKECKKLNEGSTELAWKVLERK
jgi:hypothetical protein